MGDPQRRSTFHRLLGGAALIAFGGVGELVGGIPVGALSLTLHLAWAAIFIILGALAALSRVSQRSLTLIAAGSALTVFPALLATTGDTDSPFYVGLAVLPLVVAVLAPRRSRLVALVSAGAMFWTVVLSLKDGSPIRDLGFDLFALVMTGAIGFEGSRALMSAQNAEHHATAEAIDALKRVAEGERHERMVASLATLGQIAAGVAHEINNPLAYIESNVRFLAAELEQLTTSPTPSAGDLAEMKRAMDETRQGLERVRQIVRDLKGLSHQGEDKIAVDLRVVLETTARLAAPNIRQRAQFIVDITDLPPLVGNPARLGQVFLNLLVNAAQAIPEGNAQGNEVRLAARVKGSTVRVEITDSGGGMTPEVRTKLFQPFFTTKPAGVGTGLGLSICMRIVAECGGDITVESEPGRGSIFRVELPVAATIGLDAAAALAA